MQVDWVRYDTGEWCKLATLNLEQAHFDNMSGVYVIWKNKPELQYLYVGQGFIRDRLSEHRGEWKKQYDISNFCVTWASVYDEYKDGIELFLANVLLPDFGERHPNKYPIPVNLPL